LEALREIAAGEEITLDYDAEASDGAKEKDLTSVAYGLLTMAGPHGLLYPSSVVGSKRILESGCAGNMGMAGIGSSG
jgi:SET domain-containing protein